MSVRVMTWVWHHAQAKSVDKLVLLAIADVAGDDGDVTAYKRSVDTLARKCGVHRRTVQHAIGRLVEAGELGVTHRGQGREQSDYLVIMTGGGVAPLVADNHHRGGVAPPPNGTTLPSPSSSVTPPSPPLVAQAASLCADFEALWKEYPKKDGKTLARERYDRLRKKEHAATPERIAEGVRAYVERREAEGAGPQFMKALAVVLGPQRVWADELERDPQEDAEYQPPAWMMGGQQPPGSVVPIPGAGK